VVGRVLRAGPALEKLVALHLGIVEVIRFMLVIVLGLRMVLKLLQFVLDVENFSVMLD